MRMKKAIAMLTALSLMGALVACGKETDDSSVADNSEIESSQEESSEEESSEEESSEEESSEEESSEAEPAAIDPNAITFDTPSLYTASALDDAGAAPVNLDVVSLNGDNKLRIQVLKAEGKEDADYEVPKILFDLPALIGVENTGNIDHFSVDFTCVARGMFTGDDGSQALLVGNFLGALGGNIASEKGYDEEGNLIQNDWAQQEFSFSDWENAIMTWHYETTSPLLPSNNYADNDEGVNLLIMRWGMPNQVDFFIDNLTIYDHDGNSIPIIYDAEGNTVEVIEDDGSPDEEAGAADGGESEVSDEENADEQNEADEPEDSSAETDAGEDA